MPFVSGTWLLRFFLDDGRLERIEVEKDLTGPERPMLLAVLRRVRRRPRRRPSRHAAAQPPTPHERPAARRHASL
jgi:hypothetical protein